MVIDYHQLVKDYNENLNNDLRGFRPGPGFLQTWVHDCDPTKSILSILDAAVEAALDELEIQIDLDLAREINFSYLQEEIRKHGVIESKNTEQKLLLVFRRKQNESIENKIAVACADSVNKSVENVCREGSLERTNERLVLSSTDEKITLECEIDPSGIVLSARHRGASGTLRVILDRFCAVLENRSIQEGADHGGIRLESELRDPRIPPRVRGLSTPENSEPLLQGPILLARKIYQDFLSKTGQENKRNVWIDPLPEFWLNLDSSQRLVRVQNSMARFSEQLGLGPSQINVLSLINNTRAVLSFTQTPNCPSVAAKQIELEMLVRNDLGVPIELISESLEDRNKRVERTRGDEWTPSTPRA